MVEATPKQAEGSDVNLDPKPSTFNGDASNQEREPTCSMDVEPTTTSYTTLEPEQSQQAQECEQVNPVINPFVVTASYLVDVHASKVGVGKNLVNELSCYFCITAECDLFKL